jgi:hypothetical protein
VSDCVVALNEFANGVDRIEESDRKTEGKESREHDDAEKLSGSHISHAFTIHATTNTGGPPELRSLCKIMNQVYLLLDRRYRTGRARLAAGCFRGQCHDRATGVHVRTIFRPCETSNGAIAIYPAWRYVPRVRTRANASYDDVMIGWPRKKT